MQTERDLLAGTHFVASRELKAQDVERESRGIQLGQDCLSQRPHWAGGCWGGPGSGGLGRTGKERDRASSGLKVRSPGLYDSFAIKPCTSSLIILDPVFLSVEAKHWIRMTSKHFLFFFCFALLFLP